MSCAPTIIRTPDTWIEGDAIQQLERVATLPGMHTVIGMPDLHPGRGYPVGAAFFSVGRVYPALVGNDIGCGMAFYQTELTLKKWSGEKLAQRLGSIDAPLDATWSDRKESLLPTHERNAPHRHSLGTIGGGNHFLEVQQLDEWLAEAPPESLVPGFDARCAQMLVHSGSRGWGEAILRSHVDAHSHDGLDDDSDDAHSYLADHDAALAYAIANRQLIMERALHAWGGSAQALLNVNHNLVTRETFRGVAGWLHRKGASPSTEGLVMIPGSRGDYSYLVMPTGSDAGLLSLAHGAGRRWQRAECRGRLSSRFRFDDLVGRSAVGKSKLASFVVCYDKELAFEEAPQAYKCIEDVIEALHSAGLLVPIARFRPVMTYKTAGHAC